MIKRFLLIAMLFSVPAFAQDQSLPPTGEDNPTTIRLGNGGGAADCTGTTCDATTCETVVNEDPGSPNAHDNLVTSDQSSPTIKFTFDTPTSDVSTTALAQAIDINLTRTTTGCVEDAAGTDPKFNLIIFCNGVQKVTIISNGIVTGLDVNTNHPFTYVPDGDCDAAGVNFEIQVTLHDQGGGGNKRIASINAIEWEVTHVAAGGGRTRRVF